MDYRLIEGLTREGFEEEIKKFLDDGWLLEGSVVVVAPSPQVNKFRFFQAMTKKRTSSGGSVAQRRIR